MIQNRNALVLCNHTFDNIEYENLKSKKEVDKLIDLLSDSQYGDFNTKKCFDLTSHDAEDRIEEFFKRATVDDMLLLYLNSHGLTGDKWDFHYATIDTIPGKIETTSVSGRFIKDMMSKSLAKTQLIILDCCFSGSFMENMTSKNTTEFNVTEFLRPAEGKVILASSKGNQYSFQLQSQSIYTKYLIEGIVTGKADSDSDGMISADEMHHFIQRKCRRNKVKQNPVINAKSENNIYISKVKPTQVEIVENITPEFKTVLFSPEAKSTFLVFLKYFSYVKNLSVIIMFLILVLHVSILLSITIGVLVMLIWEIASRNFLK